jgi:hypothetical protein
MFKFKKGLKKRQNKTNPQPYPSPFPAQASSPSLLPSSGSLTRPPACFARPVSFPWPNSPPLPSLLPLPTRPHSSALSPSSSPPLPHIRLRPPAKSRHPSVFPSFKLAIKAHKTRPPLSSLNFPFGYSFPIKPPP